MNSWWTTGRVIWVTICGMVTVVTVGAVITDIVTAAGQAKQLRQREQNRSAEELARLAAQVAKAQAEEARWKAEEAATKAACDDCAAYTPRGEMEEAI